MKHSRNVILSIAALGMAMAPLAATAATANDQSMYVPYSGLYGYGSNMGWYGTQFRDQDIAQLAYNAGSRTIRPSLPDWLITGYGADARIEAFRAYEQMGMRDLTAFVGEPNDPRERGTSGPDNRETKIFPGADERARTFKGLYEPVWLDAAKTQINPANTYAAYLYKTVKTYGPYVKFWEIVNEPDFTYTSAGWQSPSDPESWWNVNPKPNDLTNLKAPIFYYIRELRVAYDVIKTLEPNDYVATGGIGYPSFLDAVMRNTDNPTDGSVTAEYPLRGGAYFDVLSYHTYPMYGLKEWSTVRNDFIYSRHSDAAADAVIGTKNDFDAVLKKYGYGSTYPAKQWIMTETDMPNRTVGDIWGSESLANNFIIKAHVLSQANNIRQFYKYGLGQESASSDIFNTMGVYDNIPSASSISNVQKTSQFKAVRTISDLLYGKTYDASRTSALGLPAGVRGAAFRDPVTNLYTYVLWAKTATDKSESASATYTFPFSGSLTRREWDYSTTGQGSAASQVVTLTGTPSFFTETGASPVSPTPNPWPYPVPVVIPGNIPPIVTTDGAKNVTITTATTASVVLFGTATDPDGSIVSYRWQQVSGPTQATLDTPYSAWTLARNLSRGTYLFLLTATDNRGASATGTMQITVGGSSKVSVTAGLLNVRATPAGTIISRARYGTQARVIDTATKNGLVWNKVIFDSGTTGWVAAMYLSSI